MRVSLINANWVGADAIGQCISQQVRYSVRRGDRVQVYTPYPPNLVPVDLAALARTVTPIDLTARRDAHFAQSELYVYHYPSRHPLMESMLTLDRGVVIFYYHNVTPPELWGSDFERETLERSVAGVSTLTAYADLIVTDSEFNADQLVRDHGVDRERIRVLPLAVPFDRFAPGPKDAALLKKYDLYGKRVIEFIGRMAGNKRIDLLVEALPIVRQSVPNAVLLLVGDDASNPAIAETAAKAKARAQELGVTSHIIFTGVVADQAPYYGLADVYASASLHEGFGVPLIEAMASGVPIVASNATAHPWVIGEAGLLAEPGSAADLARQIVKVLTDDQLHGELMQRGLARARDFSLEQYETGWRKIVAEAAAWLPEQAQSPWRSISSVSPQRAAAVKQAQAQVQASELKWLEKSADVMQRGYVVRSNAPLVGPLLAWLRRNLTSHLREPYLDPTLERQVAFNREVVKTLQMLMARTASDTAPDSAQQISELEVQIAELQEQLKTLQNALADRKV
jgi:glycosyltransferase involved in cell wall biosynthesis